MYVKIIGICIILPIALTNEVQIFSNLNTTNNYLYHAIDNPITNNYYNHAFVQSTDKKSPYGEGGNPSILKNFENIINYAQTHYGYIIHIFLGVLYKLYYIQLQINRS